jgi:hypothetical protein
MNFPQAFIPRTRKLRDRLILPGESGRHSLQMSGRDTDILGCMQDSVQVRPRFHAGV